MKIPRFVSLYLPLGTLVLVCILAGCGYWVLSRSLAKLEGHFVFPELSGPVEVRRDAQGIPTIRAGNRADIAFALGFVHAQERFFQMDLLRRTAAGELAQLFGEVALEHDQSVRLHRFRARAAEALLRVPASHLGILEAYTDGVNHGLQALSTQPFEYWLLGQKPRPWTPEEIFLCVYAMILDLQFKDGRYERSLAFMRDRLPADWYVFLEPKAAKITIPGVRWEAPIAGEQFASLPIPKTPLADFIDADALARRHWQLGDQEALVGSNNWGVGGALSETRAAMVATDMHLGLRVPNIWFRASWFDPQAGQRITGVTLPGTPVMVIGSNEAVAWGYTNSYGDWSDLVRLVVDDSGERYKTPQGWEPIREFDETIYVKDDARPFVVRETRWGPIIGTDHNGELLAMRWVAHDAVSANVNIMGMETADNVAQGLRVMASAGMPQQNLLVGDADGRLAWSIAGPVPRRTGLDRDKINDWSTDSGNWTDYLTAEEYPVEYADARQRLWSANARVLADERYALIGDGGYDIGIRAATIRERLMARTHFSEGDLLAIQLDTHNALLTQWHRLLDGLADTLDPGTAERLRKRLQDWNGRAEPDSQSYPLVRRFHEHVKQAVLGPVFDTLAAEEYAGFEVARIDNYLENPLWILVQQQPGHALNPRYSSWQALLVDCAERALAESDKPWGQTHIVEVQHPLSRALPIGWLLDMPALGLPGDLKHVVRVQGRSFGASQRMVVSPGYEERGIFHMATGQSGNPLSPFYRRGHEDWVTGRASGFLPGESRYLLTFAPQ